MSALPIMSVPVYYFSAIDFIATGTVTCSGASNRLCHAVCDFVACSTSG